RVDHELQELLDLGLEAEGLAAGRGVGGRVHGGGGQSRERNSTGAVERAPPYTCRPPGGLAARLHARNRSCPKAVPSLFSSAASARTPSRARSRARSRASRRRR